MRTKVTEVLKSIRRAIEAECVSYGEIMYLTNHRRTVMATGDLTLMEWADVPEDKAVRATPRAVIADCYVSWELGDELNAAEVALEK